MKRQKIVLTGDRPTGPLHLGHYVGSLLNRIKLQDECLQYVMIADAQALTDHAQTPETVQKSILEVALDYLAVGIDPVKSIIFIQSMIPPLFELTAYYLNLVTWNRLKHNPTVKAEITQKGFKDVVPAGFMIYPVSQAADITAFNANIVPVGEDQLPMIEQAIEIVRKFNRVYHCDVLVEPKALTSKVTRLPGIDGTAKMSKSLKNAIFLSEEPDSLSKKVKKMYTDPNHLRVEDPGAIEGNPVFTYLDVFASDTEKVHQMKEHYQKGGLGDSVVKKYLLDVLEEWITPIRKKRQEYAKDPEYVMRLLKEGSEKACDAANRTLIKVKEAMGIHHFSQNIRC